MSLFLGIRVPFILMPSTKTIQISVYSIFLKKRLAA
jgi:hypothetical protein